MAVAPSSPVLTLGRDTRINCRGPRMARRMIAALAVVGVPAELVAVGPRELPAIRVLAPCEVHFERAVGPTLRA